MSREYIYPASDDKTFYIHQISVCTQQQQQRVITIGITAVLNNKWLIIVDLYVRVYQLIGNTSRGWG